MILSLIDISGCFFIMFRFERNVRIKPERRINSDYPVKPGNDGEGVLIIQSSRVMTEEGALIIRSSRVMTRRKDMNYMVIRAMAEGGQRVRDGKEKRGIKKYFEQKRKNVRFKKCQT